MDQSIYLFFESTLMHIAFKYIAIFSLFTLSACSSVTKDIQIETQAAPKTSFDGYQSYAWLASSEIMYDPLGQWEPRGLDIDSEVRFVINDNLRDRGLIEVVDKPDMYIVFGAGVDMTALGMKENPESKEEMLMNIPQAALVVGFIDADTGYLIWRGIAEGEAVGDRDLKDTRKRIEYAVKKMFKQIP